MAWSNESERRALLPSNWGAIVKAVKERDGGRCRYRLPSGARCPRPGTDVDHVGDRENHDLKNLRLLCEHHHKKVTAGQAWQGKYARRRKFKRSEEEHPGR